MHHTCHLIPFYNLLIFFSVCKTTIPELAKSLEKSIAALQSRFGIPSNWSFAVIFSVIILRFSFFLDATFAAGRWWAFVLLVKYHLSYICKRKRFFQPFPIRREVDDAFFGGSYAALACKEIFCHVILSTNPGRTINLRTRNRLVCRLSEIILLGWLL